MAFFLFILVNATMFVRPTDIVPALSGVSIYEFLILSCLALSTPAILKFIMTFKPRQQPITLCVIGIFLASILSQLGAPSSDRMGEIAFVVFKMFLYYLLLVSVINSARRMRIFMFCLLCLCVLLCVVTVLQYYGFIELATLNAKLVDLEYNSATGELIEFDRLKGSGIFQDPNEFCVMMGIAVVLCLYEMSQSTLGKLVWIGPLCLCVFAILLTQSRGGLLAVLTALGVLCWLRIGWKRTAAIGLVGLPILFLALAGRQTDISASANTGQQRVQIWGEWLMDFRYSPVFGTGMKPPELASNNPDGGAIRELLHEGPPMAAHNSYLHAFTELGFFGGMLFLGAFFIGAWNLYRMKNAEILNPQMRHLHPYLFAVLAAYMVGMLSLSILYYMSTYTILGLISVYPRVTPHRSKMPEPCINLSWLARMGGASIAYLAFIYIFVRIFVR